MYIIQINKWYFYCYPMLIIGLILTNCIALQAIIIVWCKTQRPHFCFVVKKLKLKNLSHHNKRGMWNLRHVVWGRTGLRPMEMDYFKAQVFLLPNLKMKMNKATAGPNSQHKLGQIGRRAVVVWSGGKARMIGEKMREDTYVRRCWGRGCLSPDVGRRTACTVRTCDPWCCACSRRTHRRSHYLTPDTRPCRNDRNQSDDCSYTLWNNHRIVS